MKMIRRMILLLTLCAAVLLHFSAPAVCGMFDVDEDKETVIGEDVAQSIIRAYGVVEDRAELDRLLGVTRELVKVSGRPHLDYHFYILDTDLVNAFALPGGYIFVTRGLMNEIDDDDELAAVVGHELVHVAMKHSIQMYKRGMKNMVINLLVLALTREPAAVIASEMIQQGRSEIWGRQAEIDADTFGAEYVVKAGYDPAAMMRFFEKMHRLEMKHAPIYEGYFDVHPPTEERIEIVRGRLDEMQLDVPDAAGYKVQARVYATEQCDEHEDCIGIIVNANVSLMQIADPGDSASAYERSRQMALILNRLLDKAPNIYDVKMAYLGEDPAVWVLGELVAPVLPLDAEHAGIDADALAIQWKETIKNFIWSDIVTDDF
jgi:predicted Zn-dependent protease